MNDAPIRLAVTLAALGPSPDCFAQAARLKVAGVQLDASQPGLRPRELDIGGRRDVAATLRRHGLAASGIDCFVPPDRFAKPDQVERSMTALFESIALAEYLGRIPVCCFMPGDADLVGSICREAVRRGVGLADFVRPDSCGECGVGIDPAAILLEHKDPAQEVSAAGARLTAARVNDVDDAGQRGPIGQGRLDALAYRVALDVCGFRGLPVMDCRSWRQPAEGCVRCAKRWNDLLPAARP